MEPSGCCLSIPFFSQYGRTNATAIIAMLTNRLPSKVSAPHVRTGASFYELAEGMRCHGVASAYRRPLHLSDIISMIDRAYPCVILINYGRIPTKFKNPRAGAGPHFILAIGHTDAEIICHDPWWPDSEGERRRLPLNVIDYTMSQPGWGCLPHQGFVIFQQYLFNRQHIPLS